LDFKLSEDQSLLHDMVDRVALEKHDFRVRRNAIDSAIGWHPPFWHQLAELGVLGAPVPESLGGSAGGGIAVMLIMRAFGRPTGYFPYIPTVVCAAGLLARAGSEAQCNEHLPKILSGERIFAFACSEAGDHGDPPGCGRQRCATHRGIGCPAAKRWWLGAPGATIWSSSRNWRRRRNWQRSSCRRALPI